MISRLLRTWLFRTRWRSPTCSTSKSSSFMRKIRERMPKRYALRWTCSSAGSLPPGIRARRSEDRATLQKSCGNIRRVERQSSDVGRLRRWFYRSKDPWPDRRAALRSLPGPILTYGPKASESLTGYTRTMPILVPFELPCGRHSLSMAVDTAQLLHALLDILHLVRCRTFHLEAGCLSGYGVRCERIAEKLKTDGIDVSHSLLFGKPEEVILARCREIKRRSSFPSRWSLAAARTQCARICIPSKPSAIEPWSMWLLRISH